MNIEEIKKEIGVESLPFDSEGKDKKGNKWYSVYMQMGEGNKFVIMPEDVAKVAKESDRLRLNIVEDCESKAGNTYTKYMILEAKEALILF